MSALINDIDAVGDNYRQQYSELKVKDEDYKKFCKDEKTCLTTVLGEAATTKVCESAKTVVDEIVVIGTEIEKLEVGCGDAKGELDKAKRARTEKEKELTKAKTTFEAWKDPVKSIEARFKELDKLKKEICTEHEAKNYGIAYYLLMFGDQCCAPVQANKPCEVVEEEFFKSYEKYCKQVNSPKDYPPEIVDPSQLKGKIVEAWNNYHTADACYNERDAVVKSLEKKLELMQARLDEKKKNFEKTIRRQLSELNQQQPLATQE